VALGAVGGLVIAAILFAAVAVSLIRSSATDQARAELDRQARAIAVLVSARVSTALETGTNFKPGPIGNLETLAGPSTTLYYVGLDLSPGASNPTGGLPQTVAQDLDPALLVRDGSQSRRVGAAKDTKKTGRCRAPLGPRVRVRVRLGFGFGFGLE
jgi:type II secretory pathway pseudopilin PulG